jgi:hypothetical protein
MSFLTSLLIKYGQTLGALAMAALLRYLEKTSLIKKYRGKIDQIVKEAQDTVMDFNNRKEDK